MADERIILEIQAIDAASGEIDKVIQKLKLLNDEALKPYRQLWEKGLKSGASPRALARMFPREERLRILASLQDRYNKELAETIQKLSKVREGTKTYQRLSNKVKELSRYQNAVNRVMEDYNRGVRRSAITTGGFRGRITRLNRAMNKMALQFVWSALSILGITWSMQMVIKGTLGVLSKYVNAMNNWANAAYQVALWMALAKREGIDAAKIAGGDQKQAVMDLVHASLLLKATLGSVKEAFMLFFSEVLLKYPGLKDKLIKDTKLLVDFFADPKNRKKMGEFLTGLLEGIKVGIRLLPKMINFLDKMGNTMAAISKPLIGFLSIFFPGFKDVNKELDKSHSGLEKLGVLIGAMAALAPLLTPLLAMFQFLFSLIQGIVFFASKLVGIIGKIGEAWEWIKDSRVIGWLRGVLGRIGGAIRGLFGGGNVEALLPVPLAPAYTAYRYLTGHWPREVHVNQYINIGTVNKTADVHEVTKQLYTPYSYGTGVY